MSDESDVRARLFALWRDMSLAIPPRVMLQLVTKEDPRALELIRTEVLETVGRHGDGPAGRQLLSLYGAFLDSLGEHLPDFPAGDYAVTGADAGFPGDDDEAADTASGDEGDGASDDEGSGEESSAETAAAAERDDDGGAEQSDGSAFTPLSKQRPAPAKTLRLMSEISASPALAARHGVGGDDTVTVRGVNVALLRELDATIREGIGDAGGAAGLEVSDHALPNGALINAAIIALLGLAESGDVEMGPADGVVFDSVREAKSGSRWSELFSRLEEMDKRVADIERLSRWMHPHVVEIERSVFSGNLLSSLIFAERQGFVPVHRTVSDVNVTDPAVLDLHDRVTHQGEGELNKRIDFENRN